MKNQELSRIFNEIADMLELKGDNPFRVRAYRKAGRSIEGLTRDISELTDKEILEIPGIGKDLAEKIKEFIKKGRIDIHDKLKKEIPEGYLGLLSIPGIGPETARLLFEKANIRDIDELEDAIKKGTLRGLRGIKRTKEENILKGIEFIKRSHERRPLGTVFPVAMEIVRELKTRAPIEEIEIAGSLRRWKETVRDIDIIAASSEPSLVMNAFVNLTSVTDVILKGRTKSSVLINNVIHVDLRVVEKDSFGSALQYFTGSKEHNIKLRELALKSGMMINEYGIFLRDGRRLGGEREEDVYRILGLQWIPPELRENRGEIELALENRIPELVNIDDIRGDLHVHSDWSDGGHEIEVLVKEARRRSFRYIAITDHTKGPGIVRGLDEDGLLAQMEFIDMLNSEIKGFRILKGAEVNINSRGEIDVPHDILRRLDIVVASIHSGFKESKDRITMRLLSAIENPYVNIIGHPTGRLFGERDAYEMDLERVFRRASENNKILEINSHPLRLDLNDRLIRMAKDYGIKFSISTDTHMLSNFDYMNYGVRMARRGWLEKKDIINTMNIDELLDRLKRQV